MQNVVARRAVNGQCCISCKVPLMWFSIVEGKGVNCSLALRIFVLSLIWVVEFKFVGCVLGAIIKFGMQRPV